MHRHKRAARILAGGASRHTGRLVTQGQTLALPSTKDWLNLCMYAQYYVTLPTRTMFADRPVVTIFLATTYRLLRRFEALLQSIDMGIVL